MISLFKCLSTTCGIVILVLLPIGCGGGSANDSTGATYTVGDRTYQLEASTTMSVVSLSRAQFRMRANQACRQRWPRIRELLAEYTAQQDPSLDGRQRFDDSVRKSLLYGIDFHIYDSLQMLGAPRGQRRQIEAVIGALQVAVESGRRLHIYAVDRLLKLFAAFNREARSYKLDDCIVNRAHLRL